MNTRNALQSKPNLVSSWTLFQRLLTFCMLSSLLSHCGNHDDAKRFEINPNDYIKENPISGDSNNADARPGQGCSALANLKDSLVLALAKGDLTQVEKILFEDKSIATQEALTSTGETALMLAAQFGRLAIVERLLASSPQSVEDKDSSGLNTQARLNANTEKRQQILELTLDPNQLLFLAIKNEDQDQVQSLIGRANINALNELGQTPLLFALRHVLGEDLISLEVMTAIIKILLSDPNVDLSIREARGSDVGNATIEEIVFAEDFAYADIQDLFRTPDTELIRGIRENNLDMVRNALTEGADPNRSIAPQRVRGASDTALPLLFIIIDETPTRDLSVLDDRLSMIDLLLQSDSFDVPRSFFDKQIRGVQERQRSALEAVDARLQQRRMLPDLRRKLEEIRPRIKALLEALPSEEGETSDTNTTNSIKARNEAMHGETIAPMGKTMSRTMRPAISREITQMKGGLYNDE